MPSWRAASKQSLQSSEFTVLEPSSKTGNSFEFEISTNNAVMFGFNTGFLISAEFSCKATAASTDEETIPVADYDKVILQPNWLEHCIKSIDVFHHNTSTRPHDTPPYVDAFLNTYLYANMDSVIKKYLFPEPWSTGRCVATDKTKWTMAADTDWHKYAKATFGKEKIVMRYIPIHLFPFFQQPNFMVDGTPPNAIPMSVVQKLNIRVNFMENCDHIFRKKVGNNKVYSLKIGSVQLIYEEARLSSTFDRFFTNQKRNQLPFLGVTKFAMSENVSPGTFTHRLRFQDVLLPEGIFIFALPKNVVGGQYKYSSDDKTNIFSQHNISSVDLYFGGMPFYLKSPNIGSLLEDSIESKAILDHMENPPFGLWQDAQQTNYETVANCGKYTIFPHIFLNLGISGKGTRLIPIGDDGAIINSHSDLELTLKFGQGGSTADVTYFVYIYYSDVNMILDVKGKRFFPMYNRSKITS